MYCIYIYIIYIYTYIYIYIYIHPHTETSLPHDTTAQGCGSGWSPGKLSRDHPMFERYKTTTIVIDHYHLWSLKIVNIVVMRNHLWAIQNQDKSFSSWLATPTFSPYRLLTGCTWMTWRIADQLVCFKWILIYSDLKYDPPHRPREIRIIDLRRSMMLFTRHQTGKSFPPPDVLIIIIDHSSYHTYSYYLSLN